MMMESILLLPSPLGGPSPVPPGRGREAVRTEDRDPLLSSPEGVVPSGVGDVLAAHLTEGVALAGIERHDGKADAAHQAQSPVLCKLRLLEDEHPEGLGLREDATAQEQDSQVGEEESLPEWPDSPHLDAQPVQDPEVLHNTDHVGLTQVGEVRVVGVVLPGPGLQESVASREGSTREVGQAEEVGNLPDLHLRQERSRVGEVFVHVNGCEQKKTRC